MGFVKAAAEVARIEAALARPRFGGAQMLSVEFLADPDFVATILPPPLEPVAEPRMRAMVGRWQSNCVGDFAGGTRLMSITRSNIRTIAASATTTHAAPMSAVRREIASCRPAAATMSGDGISPAASAAASGSPPGRDPATDSTVAGRSAGSGRRHRMMAASMS